MFLTTCHSGIVLENLPRPNLDFGVRLLPRHSPNTDINAVVSIPKRSLSIRLPIRFDTLGALRLKLVAEEEQGPVNDDFPVFVSAITSIDRVPLTAAATQMQLNVVLDGTQFRDTPDQLRDDATLHCAALAGFLMGRFELADCSDLR